MYHANSSNQTVAFNLTASGNILIFGSDTMFLALEPSQ